MPATKFRTAVRVRSFAWDEIFTAGVAFTGCPFKFVQPGSVAGEVVPCAFAAGCPLPLGVIQNAPAAGASAVVRLMGRTQIAACFTACGFNFGTFVNVASHAGAIPSTCTTAVGRWSASNSTSVSTANWGGYGEIFLTGPSFSSCINSPC